MTGITQLSWNGDDTQLIFTGFYKMGYDIFTLSNPKKLINSIGTIKLSKWKLEDNSVDLNRKDSTITIDNEIKDKYRNYILTDLKQIKNDPEEKIPILSKDSDNNYIRVGTYNKKEKTVMIDNYNEYVIPNK